MGIDRDRFGTVSGTRCDRTVPDTTSGVGPKLPTTYTAPAEQSLQWYEMRIKYGLLALFAMPREKRGPSQRMTMPVDYIHEAMDEGRWNKTRPAIPGPRAIDEALEVDEWLSWLDPDARKVVMGRALGATWARLIMKNGCSQSTLQRRCREALTLIRDRHLKSGKRIA